MRGGVFGQCQRNAMSRTKKLERHIPHPAGRTDSTLDNLSGFLFHGDTMRRGSSAVQGKGLVI